MMLKRALLLSVDDELEQGRFQIKVHPEMEGLKDDECPWARPFFGNSASNTFSGDQKEVGAYLWVFVDPMFKEFYWIAESNISALVDATKITDLVGGIEEIEDSTFVNLRFDLYEDGSYRFTNKSNGEWGIISSSGTRITVNSDGYINLITSDVGEIILNDEGFLVVDTNNNQAILDKDGMILEDKNGNKITGSTSGINLEDKNGNSIEMGSISVKINGSSLEVLQ